MNSSSNRQSKTFLKNVLGMGSREQVAGFNPDTTLLRVSVSTRANLGLMVNGKWTAFIQRLYPKRFTIFASHSPIHTHIHTQIHTPTAIGCHARYQPARQEQLGVRCLAQGHFDTPRVGSNRQPSDCQTTALPPEPHRPHGYKTRSHCVTIRSKSISPPCLIYIHCNGCYLIHEVG